jgi:DNA primase
LSRITQSTIQEVSDRLDAVAAVEDYVRLDKKGGRYWGLCPFHHEKTPSFTVDPDRKTYYCFGCHKGGSVIGFVMEMDKLTYPEAIKTLARKLGVEMAYEDGGGEDYDHDAENTRKEALFELYRRVAGTFQYFLKERPEGGAALGYLRSRGISDGMVERFRLGYAPADKNWLYRFLRGKGYSEEFLGTSGLFSARHRDFPLFANRLMFPIADRQGRIVAFGGRALPDAQPSSASQPSSAKYINSPETEIYKKGQTLFAIDLALPAIRRTKAVYLAEGYMDVIALHQAGVDTAVAPLGTAFTGDQAKLLRRWADTAVLVFDSDRAGQEAAVKGIVTCRQNGLSCSLVVPGGAAGTGVDIENMADIKDPAEILQKNGPEHLNNLMKYVIIDFEYLIVRARSLYDVSTPEGKKQALTLFFPYLDALDSAIERDDCIGAAADAFGVDREAVSAEYRRRRSGEKPVHTEAAPGPARPVRMNDELFLLTVVAVNMEWYPEFRGKLEMREIEYPAAKELFVALEECFVHEESGMDALLSRISSVELRRFIAERSASAEFRGDAIPRRLMEDGIKRIQGKRFRRRLFEIGAELRIRERNSGLVAESGGCTTEELIAEKMMIDAEIRKLEGR